MKTNIYILRHASAMSGEMDNRSRPLSKEGHRQAKLLVPSLQKLECSIVYSSPFKRALETVAPYCAATGTPKKVRENLSESLEKETLDQVRERMVAAATEIVETHSGKNVLICTHGGTMWGLLSHYDNSFGLKQYQQIGNPDLRKIIFTKEKTWIDSTFIW